MALIASLDILLGVKTEAFKAGLQSAKKDLGGFASSLKSGLGLGAGFSAATAAIGAIKAGIGSVMGVFEELGVLSERAMQLGTSVETMTALSFAAKQSGVSMEELSGGMIKMRKAIVGAIQGATDQEEAFKRLGLSAEELVNMDMEDQIRKVAEAMSKVGNPTERAALAMKIFGKTGNQLMPLLQEGDKGIGALLDRAKELGVVISTDTAVKADKLMDTFGEVKAAAGAAFVNIATELMPMFQQAADFLIGIAQQWMDWKIAIKATIDTAVTFWKWLGDSMGSVFKGANGGVDSFIKGMLVLQFHLENWDETTAFHRDKQLEGWALWWAKLTVYTTDFFNRIINEVKTGAAIAMALLKFDLAGSNAATEEGYRMRAALENDKNSQLAALNRPDPLDLKDRGADLQKRLDEFIKRRMEELAAPEPPPRPKDQPPAAEIAGKPEAQAKEEKLQAEKSITQGALDARSASGFSALRQARRAQADSFESKSIKAQNDANKLLADIAANTKQRVQMAPDF